MITRLDRNRLNGERNALVDEAAEESRLANITARQLSSVVDLIHEKYDECIEVLKNEPEIDIDEVILAYRKTIRRVLNKI
jgi:2-hydroxy-3-keto-5-methylthiopentenyl-1-phosphate phosphatase